MCFKTKNARTLICYVIVVLHDRINVVTGHHQHLNYLCVLEEGIFLFLPLSLSQRKYLYGKDGRSEGGNHAVGDHRQIPWECPRR